MPISAPLMLTLYDKDTDEVKGELSCTIIRSRFLKKALALQDLQGKEKLTDLELDSIAGLVCQIFNNKINVEDFWDLTELEEAWAVINSIISRAANLMGNPPPQG